MIGLALGLKGVHKWLKRHMVNPIPFLEKRNFLI
jgi:hypothetical protein